MINNARTVGHQAFKSSISWGQVNFIVIEGGKWNMTTEFVQGSPKECFPGCENAVGKLRQKWYATAVKKFSKPWNDFFGGPCKSTGAKCFFIDFHVNRRSLVLNQARCVGRRDRPGQPDDLWVEVEPPQLEVVILGTAVPPTQVLYLKSDAFRGHILLVHFGNMI